MRTRELIAGAVSLVFGVLVANCGGNGLYFNDGGSDDAGDLDSTTPTQDSNPFGDVAVEAADAALGCQGLQCQVVTCDGGAHTTISGTVYDPAGNNPLYNILVYVPTFPSDPLPTISHGMSCDTCAAKVTNAMATALTDSKGNFTIVDAPVGTNIPIVVQVGKWRREYVLPSTTACIDNPYPNSASPVDRLRLPAMQSEGDMPLIALSTGCDPMDGLLKKVGIDSTEFTSASGTGMVHVYKGNDSDAGWTSAYTFWDNLTAMEKYDILVNACECMPYSRDKGYANLDKYLNGGGRFFGSHYHINFFTGKLSGGTPDPVPADMLSAANWAPQFAPTCGTGPYAIDTTFPKGKAMADWLDSLFPSVGYGVFSPTAAAGCILPDILGTVSGKSQQWIYSTSSNDPAYISINTPTAKQPQDRCGRAVLTDLHVGTTSATLEQQEAALEFMFFDLAACVQDDSTTPQPPQPN